MTANYKTFGGNPHESAEQEPEPEQQSEQSESEQQPESEPESEQPEQPLNTKNGHATACPFFLCPYVQIGIFRTPTGDAVGAICDRPSEKTHYQQVFCGRAITDRPYNMF